MKKLILLLSALAILPLLAADFPKGSPAFVADYNTVLANAKKSGKPVVLVFSAAWCPPCQSMKKEVYPSEEVAAFHDKFEWAYLDTDDAANAKVAGKFGVSGIPHIQFLDPKGEAVDKQVGGSSPKSFAKTLEGVLAKVSKS